MKHIKHHLKKHISNPNYVLFGAIAGLIVVLIILIISNNAGQRTKQTGTFSATADNLPEATASQVVELKDGDRYGLTASIVKKILNGKEVKMLAYNGSIPGPLIKVPQDAEVTINLKNNTDVPTALHSHGVRVENKFDGVVDVTQKVIEVGESFTYKIKFPDEGIYWYHPHVREDYAQELGLYGNYLVVPKDTSYWNPVNREIPLFVDDVLMKDGDIVSFNKSYSSHALMGRFGNTFLVNGDTNFNQTVNTGEVVRFYITNAANTRIFNLAIEGAAMKLVGADNGRYEREEFIESTMVSPSERSIIEVLFDKPGTYTIIHKTPEKTYTLGTITAENTSIDKNYQNEFSTLRTNDKLIEDINALRSVFDKEPDKRLNLTLAMGQGMMGSQNNVQGAHTMHGGSVMGNNTMVTDGTVEKIEWEDNLSDMNPMSTSKMITWKLIDAETKNENMDIKWQVKRGDKVKLRLFNDPQSQHPMQHPIHIHGQRFLVVSTNGEQNRNLVWKDTVLVQNGDTVDLLVDFTNPGTWMIHCHIPEHMESGMMSKIEVI